MVTINEEAKMITWQALIIAIVLVVISEIVTKIIKRVYK